MKIVSSRHVSHEQTEICISCKLNNYLPILQIASGESVFTICGRPLHVFSWRETFVFRLLEYEHHLHFAFILAFILVCLQLF